MNLLNKNANLVEPKFPECRECFFFNSTACRSCDAGENFEERVEELDMDRVCAKAGEDDE